MAEVRVVASFNVYLSAEEFRLIGLALSGKLTRPNDQAAAAELNRRMLENRHAYLKSLYDTSLGALTKATNEVRPTPPADSTGCRICGAGRGEEHAKWCHVRESDTISEVE